MATPRDAYGRFLKKGDKGKPLTKARELDRFLNLGLSEAVRRLQLKAWQALTSANPVDIGTSRSGWVPSAGSPILDPVGAEGSDRASKKAAAASRFAENRAKAEALAQSYLVSQGKAFLANAVPWTVFLNEGSSAQAPAKYVEKALQEAITSVNQSAA